MKHFQLVVLPVIENDGKYLLTKRIDKYSDYHGKWQLPGGAMEFSETPEKALRREVHEELGIEVNIVKLIPTIDIKVRGKWQGIFISYLCSMKDENAEIILNEEASKFQWFTLEEIKKLDNLFEGCLEVILLCN
ncbi:hypothetical protein COV58_01705 [Candidatus Roizmanbacteria bacterium CG11_big_fil_rev_8_21_14_0_20_36_8]|uniref:Nudix hydrolase domain-containing protein n=1 Tax=Candidatus Roizmanbacteria bacterium CG11_big_fil_rev_8_21_14_0_20_36_8 TaxID=1974856 RepID=A0A2M6IUH0_9BACT|nr:MAG: hypothetical protein COV58_01705 [Candidatus Roizmanbacteria bacterium CG11_big_fil_rev_8_21_14_0_20_36_8]